jgi:integrase
VPVRWARLFALAVYTYTRAGELEALDWSDVHLEHGYAHVHRSVDRVRDKGTMRSTKTGVARRVPIEPELRPLMQLLREESGGRGSVFDMPSAGVLSAKLGITWMAVRGDEPLRIMQRAGHTSFETTQGYIREAENLRAGFGTVFPPLPTSRLAHSMGQVTRLVPKNSMISVELTGIEPTLSAFHN